MGLAMLRRRTRDPFTEDEGSAGQDDRHPGDLKLPEFERPGGRVTRASRRRGAREVIVQSVQTRLEGLRLPVHWDQAGHVESIGLTTFDEGEYGIDPEAAARHGMGAHLRLHVRIIASVKGDRVVQVHRFEVVDGHAPT